MFDDYIIIIYINSTAEIVLTYVINSTEHSQFREANSLPVAQEMPRILWNPEVHCRKHKDPSPKISCPSDYPFISAYACQIISSVWVSQLKFCMHFSLFISSQRSPSKPVALCRLS